MIPPRRRSQSAQTPQPRFAFPPNPSVGDEVTSPDGRVWRWDGVAWVVVGGGGGGGALTDPTTVKGDLIVRPGPLPSALARLAVGANGEVLTSDSTAALGVKWAAGGGTASFVHPQTTDSDHWIVAHNLNFRFVSVLTVSDTGDWIIGDVDWVSTTRCDINFSRAVSGTAVIRK